MYFVCLLVVHWFGCRLVIYSTACSSDFMTCRLMSVGFQLSAVQTISVGPQCFLLGDRIRFARPLISDGFPIDFC